jgi:hypothetical protein
MKKEISIGDSRTKLAERGGWGNPTLRLINIYKS